MICLRLISSSAVRLASRGSIPFTNNNVTLPRLLSSSLASVFHLVPLTTFDRSPRTSNPRQLSVLQKIEKKRIKRKIRCSRTAVPSEFCGYRLVERVPPHRVTLPVPLAANLTACVHGLLLFLRSCYPPKRNLLALVNRKRIKNNNSVNPIAAR